MRRLGRLLLVLLLLAGAVFALQGLRLLPSSVMYGRPEWVVIGIGLMAVSLAGLRLTGR